MTLTWPDIGPDEKPTSSGNSPARIIGSSSGGSINLRFSRTPAASAVIKSFWEIPPLRPNLPAFALITANWLTGLAPGVARVIQARLPAQQAIASRCPSGPSFDIPPTPPPSQATNPLLSASTRLYARRQLPP